MLRCVSVLCNNMYEEPVYVVLVFPLIPGQGSYPRMGCIQAQAKNRRKLGYMFQGFMSEHTLLKSQFNRAVSAPQKGHTKEGKRTQENKMRRATLARRPPYEYTQHDWSGAITGSPQNPSYTLTLLSVINSLCLA